MRFCTIASREYLPYARALARALSRAQPGAELWTLLVDDLDHEVDEAAEPFVCVRNEAIGLSPAELHRLYLVHGSQFLPAVKPFFIDHVLVAGGEATVYLDSDIAVYGGLEDLGELADAHGVVLSPHTLAPFPTDGAQPDDTAILAAGTFNAGVIGFGMAGRPFLSFLQGRLRHECVVDPGHMRVNEQRWLDYAPSFTDAFVLRDPGVNAAYWNLHERPLSRSGGAVLAGGAPLRAFHFSGYDPAVPDVLSRHATLRPRHRLVTEPILAELCAAYRAELERAGVAAHRNIALPFDVLPGAIPVDPVLRAIYRDALVAAEASGSEPPPDPYEPSAREAFCSWAATAYPARGVAPPPWAAEATAPGAPAPAPAPVPAAASDLEGLVAQLARSSAAALGRLDARVGDLERRIAALSPVGASA